MWTLPAGSYKIRTLDEAKTDLSGCELCGDLNRDGDKTDRIGGPLRPGDEQVWVDTDDNKSFTDETPMTRYPRQWQIGHIGKDNKATDVQESIPFVVDYRKDRDLLSVFGPGTGLPDKVDFVDIGISSGEHGSHVAGIVAANNMFGGQMDGPGPRRQAGVCPGLLPSAPAAPTPRSATAWPSSLANRGVDIINMSIGGLPALNDGDNARATLYNNIIASSACSW